VSCLQLAISFIADGIEKMFLKGRDFASTGLFNTNEILDGAPQADLLSFFGGRAQARRGAGALPQSWRSGRIGR
jgi:hypothetical protein